MAPGHWRDASGALSPEDGFELFDGFGLSEFELAEASEGADFFGGVLLV